MISIIGCGHVGSIVAYTLGLNKVCEKILLCDVQKERLVAEFKDLSHCGFQGVEFIVEDNFKVIAKSNIVIITAGAKRRPHEKRMDLLNRNATIIKEIIYNLNLYDSSAKLIIVTNPVDVLTYIAERLYSNKDSEKITIGLGTYVDTLRLKSILKEKLREEVFLPVIGEHGDNMVPLLSQIKLKNKTYNELTKEDKRIIKEAEEELVHTGAYLIKGKGGSNFVVAKAVYDIVGILLGIKEKSCIVVSSTFGTQSYGLQKDIAISLPYILSEEGIKDIVKWDILKEEEEKLKEGAKLIENYIKDYKKKETLLTFL